MAIVAIPPAIVQSNINAPSTQVTRFCEIYESDGVTFWMDRNTASAKLIDGSVSIDATRDERRSFDLTLNNTDGSLISSPGGFWYDKVIKLYRGITYTLANGTSASWECQVGEFLIDRISIDNFPKVMKVSGRDYTKRMLLSKFSQPTTFVSGTAIDVLIKVLAFNAGITKTAINTTGITAGKDFVFEKGVSRWEAAKQIADAYGYELFFDAQGYLFMREYADPSTNAPTYVLQTGGAGNLVTYTKSTDDTRIYNHVAVTGIAPTDNTFPAFAEVFNNEPSSPTRIAKLGDRLYEFDSQLISTDAQALDVATKFLKINALEQYNLSFETIVAPWLEVNQVIQFVDPMPAPGDPNLFLLTSLTIPITLSGMSGSASRITIITK